MQFSDSDISQIAEAGGLSLNGEARRDFKETLQEAVDAYYRETIFALRQPPPSHVVRKIPSLRKQLKNSDPEQIKEILNTELPEDDLKAWAIDKEAKAAVKRWLYVMGVETPSKADIIEATKRAEHEYGNRSLRTKKKHAGDRAFDSLLGDIAGLWFNGSRSFPSVGVSDSGCGTGPFIPFLQSILKVMADRSPHEIAHNLRKSDKALREHMARKLGSAEKFYRLVGI